MVKTKKYDVALSFAGEDRKYVDRVAAQLRSEGVAVFYDKYEEAKLWGKNLYTHLSDIYENKALFTVMFISEHYKNKLWTNHEMRSAQARALTEIDNEYILPALFNESIEVPGVLKTIGRILLSDKSPEELARIIVEKITNSVIKLPEQFLYADEAKADADFPMPIGNNITKIIKALRIYNWHTQATAIGEIIKLDWTVITPDQAFVLGRNIYQCAEGNEHTASRILGDIRKELAGIPSESVIHLVNGMFFEVYFDKNGDFRGNKLKKRHLDRLLELQTIKKFESSIFFIRSVLQAYKSRLLLIPNTKPETLELKLTIKCSMIKSIIINGIKLLNKDDGTENRYNKVRDLSSSFTIEELRTSLCKAYSLPAALLKVISNKKLAINMQYTLPKDFIIVMPIYKTQ